MDENSCKGETSDGASSSPDAPQKADETADDVGRLFREDNAPVVVEPLSGPSGVEVSGRCGSSIDASGPSCPFPPPKYFEENETDRAEGSDDSKNSLLRGSPVPSYQEPQQYQPQVRMAPEVEEPTGRTSIGPPPSYSFVMKQKKKSSKSTSESETLVTDRPPPPTYTGSRGLYVSEDNRLCNFQPMWRSHSQPALCHRCGVLVLTTTHSHDSVATHVAALALCLFGCWPCCLLPYCMNVCKNTYHHCPICQAFLGAYTPW